MRRARCQDRTGGPERLTPNMHASSPKPYLRKTCRVRDSLHLHLPFNHFCFSSSNVPVYEKLGLPVANLRLRNQIPLPVGVNTVPVVSYTMGLSTEQGGILLQVFLRARDMTIRHLLRIFTAADSDHALGIHNQPAATASCQHNILWTSLMLTVIVYLAL